MPNTPTIPTDRRALLAGIGGLAAGTFLNARSEAGPLAPPAAPASTPGPEPRLAINQQNTPGDAKSICKITKPGSYYLTANIDGEPGLAGILIAASNVTIDMMGFSLIGVPQSLGGIMVEVPRDNITIRNGVIRDWGESGIDLAFSGSSGTCSLIENVHSLNNKAFGIRANNDSIVRGCLVRSNPEAGISGGDNSLVESCIAVLNGAAGILAGTGSRISSCTAQQNTTDGISVGIETAVTNCSAAHNGGNGIVGNGSTITNCNCSSNEGNGISTQAALIVDCTVEMNAVGIASASSKVINCHALSNTGSGIVALFWGYVINSTAQSNGDEGISVGRSCVVRGCQAFANGGEGTGLGTGIAVSGFASLIEGNSCTGNNQYGIHALVGGSFFARNVCSGNMTANWNIAANNKCLVVNGANAGAINGDAGGVSPGSTDPNANYTY